MSSRIIPCALCGYDACGYDTSGSDASGSEPGGSNPSSSSPTGKGCPHCGLAPVERSLSRRPRGVFGEVWSGLIAVPRGMRFLMKTRGIKRWLVPPLMLTLTSFFLVLWWITSSLAELVDGSLPENFDLGPPSWEWVAELSVRWEWFGALITWLTGAVNWLVSHFYGLLANRVSGVLLGLMLGMLAAWYVFSIAYEAFAGPFLDVIQGRLETKWFGRDPRSALERPTDISADRCFRLSLLALIPSCAAILAGFLTPVPLWLGLLGIPICFGIAIASDRRYGAWLAWIARVEGGAILVSIKASLMAALILSFTWPLYFVFPPFGYVAFAVICGFATSISLLDIPCERRGWSIRQRLRFLKRHFLSLTAFGAVSGLLLAIPILGPLVMVPSASIGGLWLLCRLDKDGL